MAVWPEIFYEVDRVCLQGRQVDEGRLRKAGRGRQVEEGR